MKEGGGEREREREKERERERERGVKEEKKEEKKEQVLRMKVVGGRVYRRGGGRV
jgi:hypothetical protein